MALLSEANGIGIIICMQKYAFYLNFTAVSCKKHCKLQWFMHIMHTKKQLCEHPFCKLNHQTNGCLSFIWLCSELGVCSWPKIIERSSPGARTETHFSMCPRELCHHHHVLVMVGNRNPEQLAILLQVEEDSGTSQHWLV